MNESGGVVPSYSDMYLVVDGWWGQIEAYLPQFWPASIVVLEVTVLSILLSWVCGLACALMKA